MTYSSGRTFKTPDGWFAQWSEDDGTATAQGPFPTEEDAGLVFLWQTDPNGAGGREVEGACAWEGPTDEKGRAS